MPSQDDARARLIDEVQTGQISVADAEAEAQRLNLGPLATVPDPAIFDPMRLAHWSMPMGVAWIAYRSIERVRNQWNDYRAECWEWRGAGRPDGFVGQHHGAVLVQLSRATLVRLGYYDALDPEPGTAERIMPIGEARASLWTALQQGYFEASAVRYSTNLRQVIPKLEWHELHHYEGHGRIDELRNAPYVSRLAYTDAWLPRLEIMRLWPAPRQPGLTLPALIPVDGDGYMPLYCAAQWIATAGGAIAFDPAEEQVWHGAYATLLNSIASDKVRVIGTKDGTREPVPGFKFVDCRIDYPFSQAPLDLILSAELYLQSTPYVGDASWRDGFDDQLLDRHRQHWTRLMVAKADIRQQWPFATPTPARTGTPGRPSSMDIMLDELERRIEAGNMAAGVAAQAGQLRDWLVATHPAALRPTAKTIENRIRDRYRRAQNP